MENSSKVNVYRGETEILVLENMQVLLCLNRNVLRYIHNVGGKTVWAHPFCVR